MLGFMLLHEAGHISHGDPGEFDRSGTGSLNTNMTAEKQRETDADSFAVAQLRGAISRTKNYDAWASAQFATIDLSNLAFEMQQVRQERFFGSDLLHTPGNILRPWLHPSKLRTAVAYGQRHDCKFRSVSSVAPRFSQSTHAPEPSFISKPKPATLNRSRRSKPLTRDTTDVSSAGRYCRS